MASESTQISRQQAELFQKDMKAIGLRVQFRIAQLQENSKAARAGKLMMWQSGISAAVPDGTESLLRVYGPAAGGFNLSRFKLPEMDSLYERILLMPDGEERDALFDRAKRIAVAYMPEKTTVHRVVSYMNHPGSSASHQPFIPGWYQMVDIDTGLASPR